MDHETLGILHVYDIDDKTVWMNKIKKDQKVYLANKGFNTKGKILIIKRFLISQIGFELETKRIYSKCFKIT